MRRIIPATAFAALTASALLPAQQAGTMTAEQMEHRRELEGELQSLAVVDRKVMMPMRDGVRLATDIYRPKNVTGKVPTIVVEDALQLQMCSCTRRSRLRTASS
jgi:predicted acyl esterase